MDIIALEMTSIFDFWSDDNAWEKTLWTLSIQVT